MIDSYVEQRNWGLYYAHEALDDHPLRQIVSDAVDQLLPVVRPDTDSFTRVTNTTQEFQLGRWTIAFNSTSGGIRVLVDTKLRRTWADAEHQLAELVYQTFDHRDHNVVFMNKYMSDSQYNPTMGAPLNCGFGKCGLDACATCVHRDVRGRLATLWRSSSTAGLNCSRFLSRTATATAVAAMCHVILLELRMPDEAHLQAGAPQSVWLRVELPTDGVSTRVGVTIDLLDKTPTRQPESTSIRFVPTPLARSDVAVRVSKLSRGLDPSDVVVNGSRHLHGLDDVGGVGLFTAAASSHPIARFIALDASTSCVGRYPTPYPTPLNQPFDKESGWARNVHNNLWSTNYPLFYPYLRRDKDLRQRFVMDLDTSSAAGPLAWQ